MELENKVKSLIINIIEDKKEITPNSRLKEDLDLDDLDFIELIMDCEDEFNIEISQGEFIHIKTFDDIIIFLRNAISEKEWIKQKNK